MLSSLPPEYLEGMLRDVHDELQRRWLGKLWRGSGANLKDEIPVPFLPIVFELPPGRQQSRQKLATLKQKLFSRLVKDLLDEVVTRRLVHVDVAMEPAPPTSGRKGSSGSGAGASRRKGKETKKKGVSSTTKTTKMLKGNLATAEQGGRADPGTTGLLHRVADALAAASRPSPFGSPAYGSPIGDRRSPTAATDTSSDAVLPPASAAATAAAMDMLPRLAHATAAEPPQQQQQQQQPSLEELSTELVEALESKVISLEDEVQHLKRENSRLRLRATDREVLIEDLRRENAEQKRQMQLPQEHGGDTTSSEGDGGGGARGGRRRERRRHRRQQGRDSGGGGGDESGGGLGGAIASTITSTPHLPARANTFAATSSRLGSGGTGTGTGTGSSSKPKLSGGMESSTLALHGVFTAVADRHPDLIAASVTAVIPSISKLCDRFFESTSRIKQGIAGRLLSKLEELLRFDPAYDVDEIEECAYEMAKAVKVLVS